jgi:AraC-like DNA-binding protein
MGQTVFCGVKVLSMKKCDSEKTLCAPLLEALKTMQRWLERDGAERIMTAALTLKEFNHQPLPAHLRAEVKKRVSARVSSKGPRYFRKTLTLAKWPEDGQESNTMPALLCVLKGQVDLHIADYLVHCQPGDIIFFPPGVPQPDSSRPHYQPPYEQKSCDLLWMCPWMTSSEGMECWICHCKGAEHQMGLHQEICWIPHDLLLQQFSFLSEELQNSAGRKTAYHLLYCILSLAQREIEREKVLLPGYQNFHAAKTSASHDPVDEACSYVKSHLNQSLTIERTARQVCLSPASFTRKFRDKTGKSFNEYVTEIRLEEAVNLLQEPQRSINIICRLIGVKPARLRQLFQQHYGCSPTEFRQRNIIEK